MLKVAAIQMNSSNNKGKNLLRAKELLEEAVNEKTQFIVLPEVFNFRGSSEESINNAEYIYGQSISLIKELAVKYKTRILIGSLLIKDNESSKPWNTSILINQKGEIAARYDKIHLFDVTLKEKQIEESKRNQAGKKPIIGKIDKIKIGMSICYDLRFPELYRYYSKHGTQVMCIPSSFTKVTGEAHWHTLIKARAIENLSYILAPNQTGIGSNGIPSYGHSLIVDPFGKILAEASEDKEEILYAEIDLDYLNSIRKSLPALKHRRLE